MDQQSSNTGAEAPKNSKRSVLDKYLGQKTFLRNILVLLGGSAPSQLLSIGAMPFITRLFPASELGILGVIMTFVGLASTSTQLRLELAIVNSENDSEAKRLLKLCFFLSLPLVFLAALVYFVFNQMELFGFGEPPGISLAFVLILLITSSLQMNTNYLLIRHENFKAISLQNLVGTSLRFITQIGLGFLIPTWIGLAVGEVMSRAFGGIYQFRVAVKKHGLQVGLNEILGARRSFSELIKKYHEFPLFSMPATFLDTFLVMIPIPFITSLYGADSAGFYVLVNRVILAPTSLIGGAIRDAFHGRLARYSRDNPSALKSFFLKNTALLSVIGVFPLVTLVLFAPELFEIVFGEKWRGAGEIAQRLAPLGFLQFVVTPLSRVVFVLNQQKQKLIYNLGASGLLLGVFYYSFSQNLPFMKFIEYMTYTSSFALIVYFVALLVIVFSEKAKRSS